MKKFVQADNGNIEMVEEKTEDALIVVLTEICKELRLLRERLDDRIYVERAVERAYD